MSDFRQHCISKTACRRAKRSEIWASGVSIQCIQGTFDSYVLDVILGSFGAFLIFDQLVSRKRRVVEQNAVKIEPQERAFSVYWVLLTVKCLRSLVYTGCL